MPLCFWLVYQPSVLYSLAGLPNRGCARVRNSVREGRLGQEKETELTVVIALRPVVVQFGVPAGDHSTFVREYAPESRHCSIPALTSLEGVS